jgi:pyridoxamine 5'-phosphate oxidase
VKTTKHRDTINSVSKMRTDYNHPGGLLEGEADKDPFRQFEKWLNEAISADSFYGNAMTLSTVDSMGMPDSRVLLLRDISHGGFTFFTNYKSKKAIDIEHNPHACMLFFWPSIPRQVRIQGRLTMLPESDSDRYFASRPYESQVGAWASRQSAVIGSREELDAAFDIELEKFKGRQITRPANWGGYVLIPSLFEFWQGRTHRLHDRLRYKLNRSSNTWNVDRLMP